MRNPFVFGGPVIPEKFYGRQTSIQFIMDRVFGASRSSVALWGDRRVGKSSLLHYLSQPHLRTEWDIDPQKHHIIFVDCQSFIGQFSQQTFWDEILDQTIDLFADESLRSQAAALLDETELDNRSWRRFFRKMQAAGESITLFLDEFGSMVVNGFQENPRELQGLLAGLRTMITAVLPSPTAVYPRPLAIITATRRPLDILCRPVYQHIDSGSPFHNPFVFERLKPFTEAEVRTLLATQLTDTGLIFAETEIQHLLAMAGRHPLLVQTYASGLFAARLAATAELTDFAALDGDFDGRVRPHFHDFWHYSSKAEKQFLAASIRRQLNFQSLPPNQENARRQLLNRGLFIEDNRLFSPLFEAWLRLNLPQIEEGESRPYDPRQLLPTLDASFNEGELRELCFQLQLDYEVLGGNGKREKVVSLLEWVQRHGRVSELVQLVRRTRPGLPL
ncbi:MAG: ATP-binding protein [Chloroflexi bacterium]|nr:ATP-binding protein [Chloroflexota bacterium]